MSKRIFTDEMDSIIFQLYPKSGSRQCLELIEVTLGVLLTPMQIVDRARYLGIRMDPEHCKTVQRNAVRQSGRDNEGMRRGRRACPQNRTEADAPNYKHGMYVAPWRKSLLDCSITVEAFAAGPWGNATKRLSGPGMLTGDSVKCF